MTEVCGAEKDGGGTCSTTFGLCDCHGECFAHSPCREEERQKARSRGGHATAAGEGSVPPGDVPPAPQTLGDAVRWAAWASRAVVAGDVDTARANAAARLLKEFRQALERSESREALEKVEELRAKIESGDADLEVLP